MEIERLHEMLLDAGIEHEWIDRQEEFGFDKLPPSFDDVKWGYHIIVYKEDGERLISVIEGYGSYGYGYYAGFEMDLLEIQGLLTPEERKQNDVAGWLTAEDVFDRICRAKGIEIN